MHCNWFGHGSVAIITKEGEHGTLREALVQNLLIFGVAAPSVTYVELHQFHAACTFEP